MARLQQYYRETVTPKLLEQFSYRNVMEVPRITKITLNMGVGEAVADKKIMDHAVSNLTQIAGQKPVVTLSGKSIAGFKIRADWPIGCKVTLRPHCRGPEPLHVGTQPPRQIAIAADNTVLRNSDDKSKFRNHDLVLAPAPRDVTPPLQTR